MTPIRNLSGASFGIHLADQAALAAVPLVATLAFGASPLLVGALVACQSSAHLLGSIPFGVLVDRRPLRTLAILAAAMSLGGGIGAAVSVVLGTVEAFALCGALAGFGVVLFGLCALSIVPRLAGSSGLAGANAAIEVPRAACSFAVPLAVALLVENAAPWTVFALASLGGAAALWFAFSLPRFECRPPARVPVLERIMEGGRFVAGSRLLLPIAWCAVLWNLAFAALIVVIVPALSDLYGYGVESFAAALAAFGAGAVAGSWTSGRLPATMPPSAILLFGPGSSFAATLGLVVAGPGTPEAWFLACFALLGFGPSMWLIAQNSVRQLVSPSGMLGRVNAVIQTAIYGVRPVGALAGGAVAGIVGAEIGLVLIAATFGASFLVCVLSDLRRVASYASLGATT